MKEYQILVAGKKRRYSAKARIEMPVYQNREINPMLEECSVDESQRNMRLSVYENHRKELAQWRVAFKTLDPVTQADRKRKTQSSDARVAKTKLINSIVNDKASK